MILQSHLESSWNAFELFQLCANSCEPCSLWHPENSLNIITLLSTSVIHIVCIFLKKGQWLWMVLFKRRGFVLGFELCSNSLLIILIFFQPALVAAMRCEGALYIQHGFAYESLNIGWLLWWFCRHSLIITAKTCIELASNTLNTNGMMSGVRSV